MKTKGTVHSTALGAVLGKLGRGLAVIFVLVAVYAVGSGKLAMLSSRQLPASRQLGVAARRATSVGVGQLRHSGLQHTNLYLGGTKLSIAHDYSPMRPADFAQSWREEQLRQGASPCELPPAVRALDRRIYEHVDMVQTPAGRLCLMFCRPGADNVGCNYSVVDFDLQTVAGTADAGFAAGHFSPVNLAGYPEINDAVLGTCRVALDTPYADGRQQITLTTELDAMFPAEALAAARRQLQDCGYKVHMPAPGGGANSTIVASRADQFCHVQAQEYEGKTTLVYRFE
ncbi:MAG: hypothetical protein ACOX9E_05755 [Lentisphaeria bacterium]